MEVVQGKSTDKKIIIAQEIAFAKVLAGNNKTLRDRAVKKLRKWLTIRGTGRWEFTEEEFMRIWTGLFYCMWMSDKFLVQEELAESISKLIHCFKKNINSALLFIKCFNKRILMDWEGLDQYRIDKFNMLTRRFLRQTFIYCKEKDWEGSFLCKLMNIFYYVVLHKDNSLGFILHFISIYPEELAKVSNGNIDKKTVLILIEPFVKLIARSKDTRILKESEDFFYHLMRQTDMGIEFEEKFNAWREQGYPGEGPHCMGTAETMSEDDDMAGGNGENGNEEEEEEEENEGVLGSESKPLDPRAGSVHVFLPQIPLDVEGLLELLKKHQNHRHTQVKGRKLLKSLTEKFAVLNRGRFPLQIKKSPLIVEKTRKKHQTVKNAKKLMEFTQQIDEAPIKTKEYKSMMKDLEDDDEQEDETEMLNDESDEADAADVSDKEENVETVKEKNIDTVKPKKESQNKARGKNKIKNKKKTFETQNRSDKINNNNNTKETAKSIKKKNSEQKKNRKDNLEKRTKKKKLHKTKVEGKSTQQILNSQFVVVTPKKKVIEKTEVRTLEKSKKNVEKVTPVQKTGMKRKISSDWQVQDLDTNSPEYYKIETPKIITIERKTEEESGFVKLKENTAESVPEEKDVSDKSLKKVGEEEREVFIPVFWQKAKAKANRRSGSNSKVFPNPFAKMEEESKTPNRRISFALEKNMAQENEQYLEEVKNSPRVPFDGSKKPIQSALKSGLSPSPVNPFYRFKKIKL